MNEQSWYLIPSRLALAVVLTAGVAAAPFTINDGTVSQKLAAAQAASDDGAAEEFVEPTDPTPDIGGTGSPGVGSGEKRLSIATMNTDTPAFEEYKSAAERNDLEAAATALSGTPLSEQDVTPEMVEELNEELDVRTSLTAEQIVEAVKRDLPY